MPYNAPQPAGKPEQSLWISEKGEVDQLDRNKVPVLFGFADLGFLNSRFENASFEITETATLT
jgi:hypothetical protein